MYQFMSGPFPLLSVQFEQSHHAGYDFVGTTGTHLYPPFHSASDYHPNTPHLACRGSSRAAVMLRKRRSATAQYTATGGRNNG
jgi:hypothetical protein